jgi:hypothetical protein
MRNLEGARCVGKWWLFDSPINAAHVEARELCADCPAKEACHDLLIEVMTECSAGKAGAPSGTWAGRLYKQGEEVRVPPSYEKEAS